jgi:HEAT repeat protein
MRLPVRLASFALILAFAGAASAGPKRVTKVTAEAKPLDKKTIAKLEEALGGNDASVIAALGDVQRAGAAAAAIAPEIEAILRRGSSAAIVEHAIQALGAVGSTSSAAAIAPYARHRVPALRRAAVRALGALPGAVAEQALREALRSGDGEVRGQAALGLGAIGAAAALPDLFLALDRDVPEAAAAIGQLCAPEDCRRFTARLGKIGFEVMTSGIDRILFRASALPEEAQIAVVIAVRDLGTPEARRYLSDVATRWPAAGSKRVKQAIDESLGGEP